MEMQINATVHTHDKCKNTFNRNLWSAHYNHDALEGRNLYYTYMIPSYAYMILSKYTHELIAREIFGKLMIPARFICTKISHTTLGNIIIKTIPDEIFSLLRAGTFLEKGFIINRYLERIYHDKEYTRTVKTIHAYRPYRSIRTSLNKNATCIIHDFQTNNFTIIILRKESASESVHDFINIYTKNHTFQ